MELGQGRTVAIHGLLRQSWRPDYPHATMNLLSIVKESRPFLADLRDQLEDAFVAGGFIPVVRTRMVPFPVCIMRTKDVRTDIIKDKSSKATWVSSGGDVRRLGFALKVRRLSVDHCLPIRKGMHHGNRHERRLEEQQSCPDRVPGHRECSTAWCDGRRTTCRRPG